MTRNAAVGPLASAITPNPFARVAGTDAPADAVLRLAAPMLAERGVIASVRAVSHAQTLDDYAQIDPSLARSPIVEGAQPAAGAGYAGLTPPQREQFVAWLVAPHHAGCLAFQQLYLAALETTLVEAIGASSPRRAAEVQHELARLGAWPEWQANEQYQRTLLIAIWLLEDNSLLAQWLEQAPSPALVGIGLGMLARRGVELTAAMLSTLFTLAGAARDAGAVAAFRLESLRTALGAEPLAWALATTGEPIVQPWRCAHRDLRMALAQPDLWPALEPLIAELTRIDAPLDGSEPIGAPLAAGEPEPPTPALETRSGASPRRSRKGERDEWNLVLEFGASRSEYFELVLLRAQNHPNFVALLDEHRQITYRVTFHRTGMRRFWSLWDYVQTWESSRVYINGEEMDKWKIYPYSRYVYPY